MSDLIARLRKEDCGHVVMRRLALEAADALEAMHPKHCEAPSDSYNIPCTCCQRNGKLLEKL